MSFNIFAPSVAAWLFFSAAYWPEDRGRAILAVAAALAALVGFALDGLASPRVGRAIVAGTGVLLALINFFLSSDSFGLGNLATCGAALVACVLPSPSGAPVTKGTTAFPVEVLAAADQARGPAQRSTGHLVQAAVTNA